MTPFRHAAATAAAIPAPVLLGTGKGKYQSTCSLLIHLLLLFAETFNILPRLSTRLLFFSHGQRLGWALNTKHWQSVRLKLVKAKNRERPSRVTPFGHAGAACCYSLLCLLRFCQDYQNGSFSFHMAQRLGCALQSIVNPFICHFISSMVILAF